MNALILFTLFLTYSETWVSPWSYFAVGWVFQANSSLDLMESAGVVRTILAGTNSSAATEELRQLGHTSKHTQLYFNCQNLKSPEHSLGSTSCFVSFASRSMQYYRLQNLRRLFLFFLVSCWFYINDCIVPLT